MYVLYYNCDGLICSVPKESDLSKIDIGFSSGQWHEELDSCKEICTFHALGINSFHISYITNDGDLKEVSKFCGYSFKNNISVPPNTSEMELLLNQASLGNFVGKNVPQIRRSKCKRTEQKKKRFIPFMLKNSIQKRRVFIKNVGFYTYPYGYSKSLVNKTFGK